jgi:hypothetical protein
MFNKGNMKIDKRNVEQYIHVTVRPAVQFDENKPPWLNWHHLTDGFEPFDTVYKDEDGKICILKANGELIKEE